MSQGTTVPSLLISSTTQPRQSGNIICGPDIHATLDTPLEIPDSRGGFGLQNLLDTSMTDVTLFSTYSGPSSSESSHVPLQGLNGRFSLDPCLSPIHHRTFQASASCLSGGHTMHDITQPQQLMFPEATSTLSITEMGLNSGFQSTSMSPRGVNDTWNLSREITLRDRLVGRLPSAASLGLLFRGN